MNAKDVLEVTQTLLAPGNKPEDIKHWRLLVSIILLMMMFHVVWACGWLSPLGIEGFAQEQKVETLGYTINSVLSAHSNQLKDIQTQALEKNIVSTKQAECDATKKRYFAQRLLDLTAQYVALTGHDFHDMPACDDLK